MSGFFADDANLIALAIFVVLGGIGAVMAQVFAQRGDHAATLKRRLRVAATRQGVDPERELELAIDREVFEYTGEHSNDESWLARQRGLLDQKLAMIGGIGVLRKAAPIAAGVGFVAAIVCMTKVGLPTLLSFGIGFIVACGGLVFGLHFALQRTFNKFEQLFPDAIDLVVRSIRAGLPVSQALENIGADIGAPVGPEFRRISNQMAIGVSLDDALHQALTRINMPEMRFFAVTLILQRETGGQLAEVLLNLSDTLRQRKAMKMKIQALTSESRAASKIVAAIPVLSGVGMYYLNKPSVDLLFETETGNNMLIYCVGSVLLGLLIIKKLTAVDD